MVRKEGTGSTQWTLHSNTFSGVSFDKSAGFALKLSPPKRQVRCPYALVYP